MFSIKDFSLLISGSWWLLLLFTAIVAVLGYYYYKNSLADLSPIKKFFLRIIRFAVIFLLLLLAFEPIADFEFENVIRPQHFIFLDRSKSLFAEDAETKKEMMTTFESRLSNSTNLEYEIFSFGDSVSSTGNNLDIKSSKSAVTNFEKIFSFLKKEKLTPSTITIISDGIINDGENPIYIAEKINIPIFTIGLGDTATQFNLKINDVVHNSVIYAGQPTTIRVSAVLEGKENTSTVLDFFEEDKLISTSSVDLKSNSLANINFEYTPKTGGEKKLSLRLREVSGEKNVEDNKKIIFIKALGSKTKITLLSGVPSFDQRYIKAALQKDTNNHVDVFSFLPNGEILEGNNLKKILDESEILFLINFPSNNCTNDVVQMVTKVISERSLPYFFLLTNNLDAQKLKLFGSTLPIIFRENISPTKNVQPLLNEQQIRNPILGLDNSRTGQLWNNLPVVYQSGWDVNGKPESTILLTTIINNIPLKTPMLITRKFAKEKSILINASDIWRWKMLANKQTEFLFDNFILNCAKWLNADEELQRINIRTNKKFYAQGEEVNFFGEVYDESFNPVNDAEIKIVLQLQGGKSEKFSLISSGNGYYETTFQPMNAGDYEFTGAIEVNGKNIGSSKGRFNVGEIDIEMLNLKTDVEFLNLLADKTGGKFFFNNFEGVFEILESNIHNKEKIIREKKEIAVWNYDWILFLIILLFGIEWFIRKREGLL